KIVSYFMISFHPLDIVVIVAYFAIVVFIGFKSARKTTKNEVDFLLAGRSLTLPLFVMTLVSTWYGGILGVGEFSYRYGISNWFLQGLPYYLFAAIFAAVLAKKIRETNLISIPDKLHQAYDKKTAILGSFLTFILMTPAPYILMLSVIFQMMFGWGFFMSVVVTAVVALSYLYFGGFRSDVYTDVFEFILMFVGFAVILPFAFYNFGGIEFLKNNLPPLHFVWHGEHNPQYIIVWFFIALWTLVDPAFHQRCYAAKDAKTAQRGIFVSIIFWFLFDVMTSVTGLYARAALPNLSQPIMAYPQLANLILPPVAKGLFFVGMLATMMSTLNTLGLVSAQTLGRDIFLRLKNSSRISNIEHPILNDKSVTFYTRIGLVVSFLFSVLIAVAIPSVIKIWYTIGTVVIPGLLVPLMASYFEKFRIKPAYAFGSMLFGWLTSLTWMVSSYLLYGYGMKKYFLGIEPMFPGIFISFLIWFVGRYLINHRLY
ncbi:MAG: sodium:solute symporter family protein, partial [Bacteroidetes bacterium]|nr:sodium:solute symporter family protein [Bacteroidota bacterium]